MRKKSQALRRGSQQVFFLLIRKLMLFTFFGVSSDQYVLTFPLPLALSLILGMKFVSLHYLLDFKIFMQKPYHQMIFVIFMLKNVVKIWFPKIPTIMRKFLFIYLLWRKKLALRFVQEL